MCHTLIAVKAGLPMFAFISITTPLLLAGFGLLSLPIVAHLLQRRSRRQIVFPTVAFLLAAVATQSRFHKLKRWLLLLLRLLAVACIVLAFARPVWFDPSRTQAGAADRAAAIVLLLDVSASSAQQIDGVSYLERLRAAANRALDDIRSGVDVANIVYADAQPNAALPRVSPNLPALRAELQKMSASEERADLATAVATAGKMLAEHRGPRRLVVLSDLQATNWADALEGSALSRLLPSDTLVTVADVDTPVPENLALGNPRFYPPQPIAGQTCELTVHVTNYSEAARQVLVALAVQTAGDAAVTQDQTVMLGAGESRDVLFSVTAPERGRLLATFSVPHDALEADNRAYLVLEATGRIPLLLVSDDSPSDASTSAYYLLRSSAPRGDDTDRFDVRHRRAIDLTAADLKSVGGVIVGYLGELSAGAAKTLVDYMDAGGGVVFFCGEGLVPRNLEAIASAAGERQILPWAARRSAKSRAARSHSTLPPANGNRVGSASLTSRVSWRSHRFASTARGLCQPRRRRRRCCSRSPTANRRLEGARSAKDNSSWPTLVSNRTRATWEGTERLWR